MTGFDWIAANKQDRRQLRICMPYAAMHAQASSEQTYEEFQATTSGYVNRRSYEWLIQEQRKQAVNLFSMAVERGFIDC